MATPSRPYPWFRRAAVIAALVVAIPVLALVANAAIVVGGDAVLQWNESIVRDWIYFREEQRLESAVRRAIKDDSRPLGQPVTLNEIVQRPMRRACIEGGKAVGSTEVGVRLEDARAAGGRLVFTRVASAQLNIRGE